ncbi:MAG TPA: non-homologous end-joining DNA ligase [Thermoanaerobaculia bacterium]
MAKTAGPPAPAPCAPDGAAGDSRIPRDANACTVEVGRRSVRLTNLDKVFWPDSGITKGDLLRYYEAVAPVLVPHTADRAMVMKRYPNGIDGKHFFMKRTPSHAPGWLVTCPISHGPGNVIEFPVADDLAALLWLINAGCIDLNPWYSRCDDTDRPDFLHFDLDPVEGEPPVPFARVREAALVVRDALVDLGMQPFVKTTGSRGLHVYVAIERGPVQKEVWRFAKALAKALAERHPELLTAEYRIADRPAGRVLVDYNQNAWGRTLASVYSVRPRPRAPVSTPVGWDEVEAGVEIADFRLDNVPARVAERGDLWAPLLAAEGRFDLAALVAGG